MPLPMRWDYPPLEINPVFSGLGEIIIIIIIIIIICQKLGLARPAQQKIKLPSSYAQF